MGISRRVLLSLISIIILVFIATACDSQEAQVSRDVGKETSASKDVKTEQTAEKPMFVDIVSTTSPISPGGDPVTLFAKTRPGAVCEIKVGYKGGPNEAKALFSKQAETNGLISWTWTVDTSVALGKYPITITAKSLDGQTATDTTNIEVKSAEECQK